MRTSFSRLDYFIISQELAALATSLQMGIGNWESKRDHAKITLTLSLPPSFAIRTQDFQPWSIPQPQLNNLTEDKILKCKQLTADVFGPLLVEFQSSMAKALDKCACADKYSQALVRRAIDFVENEIGAKRPTHRKGKFQMKTVVLATAEITTIQKARDLIRTLCLREASEEKQARSHLEVLLDRLCRMGLSTVPRSLELSELHQWAETYAPFRLKQLKADIRAQNEDARTKERKERLKWFLDQTPW
jgi:hypothetical protein